MKVYPIQFSISTLFMGTLSLGSYHLSQCVWEEEDREGEGQREQRMKSGRDREGRRQRHYYYKLCGISSYKDTDPVRSQF